MLLNPPFDYRNYPKISQKLTNKRINTLKVLTSMQVQSNQVIIRMQYVFLYVIRPTLKLINYSVFFISYFPTDRHFQF